MLDTGWIVAIALGGLLVILTFVLVRRIMSKPKNCLDNRDGDLNNKYDHARWNALIASIEKDTHWDPKVKDIDNAL